MFHGLAAEIVTHSGAMSLRENCLAVEYCFHVIRGEGIHGEGEDEEG